MASIFFYLGVGACLATLGVLTAGIGGFGSGKMTPQRQNQMMQLRIVAQAVAVIFLILLAMSAA